MNICMILDKQFPPDPRVENEALALVNAGNKVSLLSYNHENLSSIEKYKGIKIIRFSYSKKWAKRWRALVNTLPMYELIWQKEIKKIINQYKINVLHVHDLYMVGAALRIRQNFNLPIVADLHENYVEGLKHYHFATTFPGNILISISKWERTEKLWCNQVDKIVVVIDEAIERLANIGISKDKITVVANYVNIEEFKSFGIDVNIVNRFKNNFVISYMGGFDLHRGLESVIKALPLIKHKITNLKVVLIGQGKNSATLKQLAKELRVDDIVCFEGWQPFNKFPSYINASHICLIPHLKTVHTDNTIPHKLFHYMLFKKPVIATNCKPIKRILETEKAGVIYESNNHAQLAEKAIFLYNSPNLMTQMGTNGKNAVLKTYNWNATSKNLIQLYESFKTN